MAKITKDTPKWGKLTKEANGLCFVGEELVPLYIPEDDLNPVNHRFLCINGNQIVLGVGEKLKVPASVADNWDRSVRKTSMAKKAMKQSIEIKA